MERLLSSIISLVLLAALSVPAPVGAAGEDGDGVFCDTLEQSAHSDSTQSFNALNKLFIAGCLGGVRDTWPLARAVPSTMQEVPKEPDLAKIRSTVIGELRAIREALEQEAELEGNSRDLLRGALQQAIMDFEDVPPLTIGPHQPQYWQYSPATGTAYVGIDARQALAACEEPGKVAECTRSYVEAKILVRYATVTKRALSYVSARNIGNLAKEVALYDKRWGHYFNDARSQFFWELWLNGQLYGATQKDGGGLKSPPNYQVILLHPSVGLEFVDTRAGDRFREAIVLEGIGYNGWRWSDGDMKFPLGISLIGIYGDRSSVPEFGWGALLHYNNNLSLGITRRGGHTGAVLSLDLAKLFLKQGEDNKYKFKYRLP